MLMLLYTEDVDYCTQHSDCHDENARCYKPYQDCNFGKCQCFDGYYMASQHVCKLGMLNIKTNIAYNCNYKTIY